MPDQAGRRIFAVAGDPIAHSLSPAMHNAAITALGLDAVYVAARTTERAFPGLVHSLLEGGGGLNVTAPFKAQAASLVQHPSDTVRRTGACNTIWGRPGDVHGDNTDVPGVRAAAQELMNGHRVERARICGTGGSARGTALALGEQYPGVALCVVSRTAERAGDFVAWARGQGLSCAVAAPVFEEYVDLEVNCTPLVGDLPLRPQDVCDDPERDPARPHAFLDLNYRPGHTVLVRVHRTLGVAAMDGRGMLVAQGVVAFERFFGVTPPVDVMRAAVEDALRV